MHDKAGVQRMRDASAVARDLLSFACELVHPGVTTEEIDRRVHEHCVSALRVYPSPLNYAHFPKSLCTSVNEVVCHGIPDSDAELRAGDLVKLDVSCYVNGYHGDTCRTIIAGGAAATDAAGRRLVSTTKHALDTAAAQCGPGVPFNHVGAVIEPIAAAAGYVPVRVYAGHGIGRFFHTLPLVYHHINDASDVRMAPGMTFTIEPMLVEGAADVLLWPDGWTVVTADGRRAAQFEHTLLITEHGCDVLTRYEEAADATLAPTLGDASVGGGGG